MCNNNCLVVDFFLLSTILHIILRKKKRPHYNKNLMFYVKVFCLLKILNLTVMWFHTSVDNMNDLKKINITYNVRNVV